MRPSPGGDPTARRGGADRKEVDVVLAGPRSIATRTRGRCGAIRGCARTRGAVVADRRAGAPSPGLRWGERFGARWTGSRCCRCWESWPSSSPPLPARRRAVALDGAVAPERSWRACRQRARRALTLASEVGSAGPPARRPRMVWRRARRLRPPGVRLAEVLARQGDGEGALRAYERLVAVIPRTPMSIPSRRAAGAMWVAPKRRWTSTLALRLPHAVVQAAARSGGRPPGARRSTGRVEVFAKPSARERHRRALRDRPVREREGSLAALDLHRRACRSPTILARPAACLGIRVRSWRWGAPRSGSRFAAARREAIDPAAGALGMQPPAACRGCGPETRDPGRRGLEASGDATSSCGPGRSALGTGRGRWRAADRRGPTQRPTRARLGEVPALPPPGVAGARPDGVSLTYGRRFAPCPGVSH